ncbi:MAG TPA: RHS repeat-associated core domain-containing protein [Pyrinomonadaceae bacterium]
MLPFYRNAHPEDQQIQKLLALLSYDGDDPATLSRKQDVERQVAEWRDNPFNPHLIARLRITAYQKNVVMRYIDNLIAWGDQLFSRDTIESINEATQLYVLASNMLGPRPQRIPPIGTVEPLTYGESHPQSVSFNLRGKLYQRFDGAGLETHPAYDFKGNSLSQSRQLCVAYETEPDWSAQSPPALENDIFTTSIAYDALNRVTSLTTPDASEILPVYNESNLLASVSARLRGASAATVFVENIDYDAKGQRTRIEYGNQARTDYSYDPLTLRLTRLLSTRFNSAAALQDLRYTFDPIGNITEISDEAQPSVIFDNVVVSASAQFTYDAIYRLIYADGREHIAQGGSSQVTHDDSPRKVVEKQNGLIEERIYLDGFEIFRQRNAGGLLLERETLHVTDDTRPIALVETKTHDGGAAIPDPAPLSRFQLGNHLGTACMELDEAAAIISYEEYYAYGSTSFHAAPAGLEVSAKRYRYTGKERDEETALYYHNARYYAPWLGRWTSCDPEGLVDGPNLYRYARNNPVIYSDPGGTQPTPEDKLQASLAALDSIRGTDKSRHLSKIVPDILSVLEKHPNIPFEKAYWLVAQSRGEQSLSNPGNRLFNQMPDPDWTKTIVTTKPGTEPGTVVKSIQKLVLLPGQDDPKRGIEIKTLESWEDPAKGFAGGMLKSPFFVYSSRVLATEHHLERLEARFKGAFDILSKPGGTLAEYAVALKASGYATKAGYVAQLSALADPILKELKAWLPAEIKANEVVIEYLKDKAAELTVQRTLLESLQKVTLDDAVKAELQKSIDQLNLDIKGYETQQQRVQKENQLLDRFQKLL